MMKKVLVFDFGASSGRAMLFTLSGGQLTSKELHRFENRPIYKGDTLYWDIDTLFAQIDVAVKMAQPYSPDAVSIDTWGVDFGLLDEEGILLEAPVHYRDTRTEDVPKEVFTILSEDELYQRTGIQSMRINTLFQLFALKTKRPELFKKAKTLLFMPDLFSWYLTGEIKCEYTEATTSQLLNARTKDWDSEILEALDLPKSLFPPIIQPGEIYGRVKPSFGLGDIPVIAAPSHDTASAVSAVPGDGDDALFISCGTWALFGTLLEQPILAFEAKAYGLSNEGGPFGTIMLLKNIMGMWLIQESRRWYKEQGMSLSYAELEKLAEETPSLGLFIDPNDDMFTTPGEMPKKICKQLEQKKLTPPDVMDTGAVLRIIYESLALEFSKTKHAIQGITGKQYGKIHLFGGGAKDSLLCKLTAQSCGCPVVAGPIEATATGNAFNAFIALKALTRDQSRQLIQKTSEIKTYLG